MAGFSNLKGWWPWPWPLIGHIVVYHPLTSTYVPNCIEIEETFCGRTDVHTDGHLRPALLGRLCQTVDLKINMKYISHSIAGVIFTLAASSSKLNASVWCPSCLSYLLSNLNNYYIFIHRNGRKKYNNTKNNKNWKKKDYLGAPNVTHHCTARDAASVHFRLSITSVAIIKHTSLKDRRTQFHHNCPIFNKVSP